jgi:hypothetical protein
MEKKDLANRMLYNSEIWGSGAPIAAAEFEPVRGFK